MPWRPRTLRFSCTATLALIEEKRKVRGLHGMCEVGVVHHDQRGLPSKLKGHSLQVGSACRLLDDMTNFSGACEGHLVHVHVLGNCCPSCWSIPWNHVDHPWGEASFITTVFPVARAGPSFHACISSGKFQGMI